MLQSRPKIFLLSRRYYEVFIQPTNKQMLPKASLLSKELNIPLINYDQPLPLLKDYYLMQQTPHRLQIALMKQGDPLNHFKNVHNLLTH